MRQNLKSWSAWLLGVLVFVALVVIGWSWVTMQLREVRPVNKPEAVPDNREVEEFMLAQLADFERNVDQGVKDARDRLLGTGFGPEWFNENWPSEEKRIRAMARLSYGLPPTKEEAVIKFKRLAKEHAVDIRGLLEATRYDTQKERDRRRMEKVIELSRADK